MVGTRCFFKGFILTSVFVSRRIIQQAVGVSGWRHHLFRGVGLSYAVCMTRTLSLKAMRRLSSWFISSIAAGILGTLADTVLTWEVSHQPHNRISQSKKKGVKK